MRREPPLPPPRGDQTSVLLRQMLDGLPGERVPVGHIVAALALGGVAVAIAWEGIGLVLKAHSG